MNPPEDRALLARNLGIWCLIFGVLALLQVALGAFSIMAAITGPIATFHGANYFQGRRAAGGNLTGANNAPAGIVLACLGMLGFVVGVVIWSTRTFAS